MDFPECNEMKNEIASTMPVCFYHKIQKTTLKQEDKVKWYSK